jgi:DNA-binding NtrC family response regulator
MHRAILLATGDEIDDTAILLTGENLLKSNGEILSPVPPLASATVAATAPSPIIKNKVAKDIPENSDELLGKTVAEVEQKLIIDTLQHCLGNRTHAATILGISIRTLRNKLKAYSDEGIQVISPGDLEKV